MSKTDESPSRSGPEPKRRVRPRPFLREEWRELNAAQLVCIAGGTVAGFFGVFGGVILLLSVIIGVEGSLPETTVRVASIPAGVALLLAAGAVVFTRGSGTRRAAWQESSPAVLMALAGLLCVAIAWLLA